MDASPSPLRGKYLVRNPLANRCLRILDRLLSFGAKPSHSGISSPQRILVANGAHMGDVLLSTAVLPILKQAFPTVSIGFLTGSWSRPIVEAHPLLQSVHYVDHWKLNRASIPFGAKISQYRRSRRKALSEIRHKHYDIAIDFYFYFPNFSPLLWQSGIPVRIGYASGGFGPLFTHCLEWRVKDCHITDYYIDLLRVLPLPGIRNTPARLNSQLQERPKCTLLPEQLRDDYLVIHMGTGAAIREWPLRCWIELVDRLVSAGHSLVFTGVGAREKLTVAQVIKDRSRCLNWCERLSWLQFVDVIRCAKLLVCVESLAGHVAAAVGTPVVAVYSGTTHPLHWRPYGKLNRVLSAPVACAPCYRSRGCATMDCVRDVSVDELYRAIHALMECRAIEATQPCLTS